jgi:hypothetical protein
MDFTEYIKPELLVLIPVLYLIGLGLKKSQYPDKWIPVTLGAIGIFLSLIWVLGRTLPANSSSDILTAAFTAVVQGVLLAGASVYTNQVIKQTSKNE